MKTITMDYETYIKELKQAKIEGFNLTENLYDNLLEYMRSLNSYDSDVRFQAQCKMNEILNEVGKVKSAEILK